METLTDRTGLHFDLHLTLGDRRLPAPIERSLSRVIQEAVTNIVKHAAARRVSIIVETTQGEVTLIVEDDGIGFEWNGGGPPDSLAAVQFGGNRLYRLAAEKTVGRCWEWLAWSTIGDDQEERSCVQSVCSSVTAAMRAAEHAAALMHENRTQALRHNILSAGQPNRPIEVRPMMNVSRDG